ncbi:MAG: hypothetical protein AB9866_10485 [Syntrophobacteraceae bacterium]
MNGSGDDQFLKEFQRRKLRMLRCYAFSMILIVIALGLFQFSDEGPSFLSIESMHLRSIAVSQFIAAMVFAVIGFNQYRCPSCNELLRGHDRHYLGVLMAPEKCPGCGKRLK